MVRAKRKYPPHPSLEHSYTVLMEEVRELGNEIGIRTEDRNIQKLYMEAVQTAAMAIRLIVDDVENKRSNNDYAEKVQQGRDTFGFRDEVQCFGTSGTTGNNSTGTPSQQ